MERSRQASLAELRNECEQTKATADRDAEERHRRIHAARFARKRSCPDGSGEIVYRSTRDEVAELWAVIAGFANEAFNRARRAGRHEPSEAYAADGMLGMALAAAVGSAPCHPAGAAQPGGATSGTAKGDGTAPPGDARGSGDSAGDTASADESANDGGDDGGATRVPTTGPSGSDTAARLAGFDSTEDGASPDHAAPRATGPPAVDTLPGLALADGPTDGFPLPQGSVAPKPSPPPARARSPVPTKIVVRIDLPALLRGWVEGGETCDIAGIGPVAVSAVRAMMESGDPFLAAVVTRGVDVVSVAHLGRRPNAYQQTALDWLAPTCRVLGCDAAARLEYDHRHDWADTHVTLLAWLDRLCDGHHDKKTHDGWALVAGTGKRPMVPPDDPRHPRHLREEEEAGVSR